MATVALTEAASDRPVDLAPGDVVEVRLPENPTTGFRWHAESDPPGGLAEESDRYESGSPLQPGAAGVRVLSFRTRTPGRITLRLKLWREWEGESSVQARREFIFHVKAPAGSEARP